MSSLAISTSGLLASTALVADAAKAAASFGTVTGNGIGTATGATGIPSASANPVDIVDIGSGGARTATSTYTAPGGSGASYVPDLGPVQGALDQITAAATYQSNVAAIRSAELMLQSLLATIA